MYCAIDVGHGYTKALSESGERGMYPSWIALAPNDLHFGPLAAVPTVVNGQPHLIGNLFRRAEKALIRSGLTQVHTDSLY